MKPEAIEAAAAALARAQKATQIILSHGREPLPHNMVRVLEAWSDVLTYGNRVFGKPEQGAKWGPGDSWFKAVKADRSADPLLHYLHEARNAEDHGIKATSAADQYDLFVELKPGVPVTMYSHDGLANSLRVDSGPNVRKEIGLLAVKWREGLISVPHEHKGQPILDSSPYNFAVLFIARLEEIIEEARTYLPASARSLS